MYSDENRKAAVAATVRQVGQVWINLLEQWQEVVLSPWSIPHEELGAGLLSAMRQFQEAGAVTATLDDEDHLEGIDLSPMIYGTFLLQGLVESYIASSDVPDGRPKMIRAMRELADGIAA